MALHWGSPLTNQPYPIQMPFLFSLLFLHYPINYSIVSSWKNQIWNFSNWAKCSQLDWDHKNLGLQINRDLPARNQVPTMNRRGLFYVESPYPFLLYVKFTNPAPCLKHTHLKRCLYYNHLPQPISAAHRKRKILQKKPLRNPFFEALSQTKLKIPMLMTMTSTPPWQRNEETATTKTKLMPRPAVSLQKSKQKQL